MINIVDRFHFERKFTGTWYRIAFTVPAKNSWILAFTTIGGFQRFHLDFHGPRWEWSFRWHNVNRAKPSERTELRYACSNVCCSCIVAFPLTLNYWEYSFSFFSFDKTWNISFSESTKARISKMRAPEKTRVSFFSSWSEGESGKEKCCSSQFPV